MKAGSAVWPGSIVTIANLVVIAAWIFGDLIGVMMVSPLAFVGLGALGFGLWRAREPLLLLGLPLLALPLGLCAVLFSHCARGTCS